MVVRRSDARRRRLVVEPATPTGDAAVGEMPSQTKRKSAPSSPPKRTKNQKLDTRAYAFGAERRNQLKTTDLIPKRILSCLLVVLSLLACLAAINLCANLSPQWHAQIGDPGLVAFSIGGQGSIANWFLAFLMIMTGLSCLQIYAIRQHRCNDYRGTYRLWVWLAAIFIIGSVGFVVDLAAVLSSVALALTQQGIADRIWLPLTVKLVVLSAIAARVLYEVRESRGSLALGVFVWLAYAMASIVQLPAANTAFADVGPEMVVGNCILFGTAALLLAHLTYGRFIFLQANGLVKQKSRSKTTAKQKKTSTARKQKSSQTTASPKKATTRKKKTNDPPQTVPEPIAKKATKPKKVEQPKTTAKPDLRVNKKSSRNDNKSPSEVLKELAAASRAKQNSKAPPVAESEFSDDDLSAGVIKMSKSQRRKQRKLEKQSRRAA